MRRECRDDDGAESRTTVANALGYACAAREALSFRVSPDMDLRGALENAVATRGCHAAFVFSGIGGIGSLPHARLAGTASSNGSQLHMSVANAEGRVFGGHVASGCTVRTTAEVLLVLLSERSFTRELDHHRIRGTRCASRTLTESRAVNRTGSNADPPVARR